MVEEKKDFRCKLCSCVTAPVTALTPNPPSVGSCIKHHICCEGSIADMQECPEWAGKEWPLYAVDCDTGKVTHIKTGRST